MNLQLLLATGWIALLGAITSSQTTAQIDVTFPVNRMVVQRNNANQATVQVAGSYAQPLDVIEARVVARVIGQGTTTPWTPILTNPTNGQFSGTMTVGGGWYQLEVHGLRNGLVVATDVVDRFGVGEVFAIVGHSNAQGSSCILDGVDKCPSIDGATDDRVTVVALDQTTVEFDRYKKTVDTKYLPGLVFSQLTTFGGISPFAKMAWFWGHMGDVLVQRINVPVLLYNAGFGGSNMEHNYKAAYDIPFDHSFIRYSIRMPYSNVRTIMNLYVPSTGIRAVLLNHGENDRTNLTSDIVTYHYGVIDKTRQEANMPQLAWIVAISSYFGGRADNVRQAQFQVINRANYRAYLGPDMDNINSIADRPDGGHYSPSGQRKAGELWANAITNSILQTSTPYPAQLQPLANITCGTGNQLRLTQPPGYQYLWNTGDSIQALTASAGTYSARIRDSQKKVLFPPDVTVPASVRYNTPTISSTGTFEFCTTNELTLTSSNLADLNRWSTGATTAAITVTTPGSYSLQTQNAVYGCLSTTITKSITLANVDLSLSMYPNRRIVAVGDTVTFTITVSNESACDAAAVTIQNQLPPNLAFVSSPDNLTEVNNIVSGTVATVLAGSHTSRQYIARLLAPGLYWNAAQLTTSSKPDPDSQPNSGTGDGQDDATQADVRTSPTTSALVYVSPNPAQTPLPTVQSNQPIPDPNKVDLSLSLQLSQQSAKVGEIIQVVLTVHNRGGLNATNIGLRHELPTGLTFISSDSGMNANGQLVNGSISQISQGQSVGLSFMAQVTGLGALKNAAQIRTVDQSDSDSTPNSGTTDGQDDTAQVTLRVIN